MIFNPSIYRSLKSRIKARYEKDLKSIIKTFKKLPDSEISVWFADHASELKEYSPLKWLFLNQVQTFIFFSQNQNALSKNAEEFGEVDDMVFEKWNKSEFADVFLKALNSGKSVSRSSLVALKVFDQHLVSFGDRQILRNFKIHRHYRTQSSLGDVMKAGKLGRLLETTLHLEGKELGLMTSTMKEMKHFSQRIEIALKVIRKHSPTSWDRFSAFTDLIIPIKQKEFVSYSHQELPGVSMINLFDRDFVDLMDDLLHENGHHHLNYYLNTGKLIDEPLEMIYYSPWRRTPRPLRGIYHAYFTFFWAFRLFADLASAKEVDSIWYLFSASEKEKIYWRAVEEFYMLEYTFIDLKYAYAQGLINKKGWELIVSQRKELLKMKRKVPLWEKKLKSHRKDLQALKKDLKAARKQYAL